MVKQKMTAKEYAKHVEADVRTVRRWMRNGMLKFTPPPREHPHYARLIDSNQPRPKKKVKRRTKSTITAGQNIKRVTNISRPASNPVPNTATQPRASNLPGYIYPRNPAFEKMLRSDMRSAEPEPESAEPENDNNPMGHAAIDEPEPVVRSYLWGLVTVEEVDDSDRAKDEPANESGPTVRVHFDDD